MALPPLKDRPAVLVDRVQGAGLLLPSVQETIKAVVMGLNARYGVGFVALEDELHNTRQLRRMSRGMKLPEQGGSSAGGPHGAVGMGHPGSTISHPDHVQT
ncbi:MAG: hypothetical protein IPI55_16470 [Flavobacteriales bacterium]|nr:hypothetical protein [Flavobacteriales bacterium]